MLILHSIAPTLPRPNISFPKISHLSNTLAPISTLALPIQRHARPNTPLSIAMARRTQHMNEDDIGGYEDDDDDDGEEFDEFSPEGRFRRRLDDEEDVDDDDTDEFSARKAFGLRGEIGGGADKGGFSARSLFGEGNGKPNDYERDPEFAEILGTIVDDPQKAQSKMEDRFKKKKNSILQTKTGSATPMKVLFNKFDYSNSYIWFEFYNIPLEKDIYLIRDVIRSWYIIGCLGGCNAMNMQLSQSEEDSKTPSYDALQGADVTPTTFYNIGNLEVQYNVARVWVDVGTSEPLVLDILINALTQISSDYVGIKQVVFGGSEYENWKEDLNTEETGYSVHNI